MNRGAICGLGAVAPLHGEPGTCRRQNTMEASQRDSVRSTKIGHNEVFFFL